MKTDTPRPILLKDYRPSELPDRHASASTWRSNPTRTRVRARLKVRRQPRWPGKPGPLRLDGELLELESLRARRPPARHPRLQADGQGARSSRAVPAQPFTLETVTTCNPEANKALTGLYLSRGHLLHAVRGPGLPPHHLLPRPARTCSPPTPCASRPTATRRPCCSPTATPLERGTLDGGKRHYAVWRDPHPKPCYLFALVGGNLASDRLRLHAPRRAARSTCASTSSPARRARCAWAMDSLKRSMRWDEERFGREYDLDVFNIVAVSDFNMGAMENKGLNIFNDALVLASPETATDAIFVGIERVIAHEYFHNWTGNRITCRDWFQLCLKEGPDRLPRPGVRRRRALGRPCSASPRCARSRPRQFPEDAGPAGASRAARQLHRDQQLLHGDRLREGRRGRAHDRRPCSGATASARAWTSTSSATTAQAATVEEFVACFEDASGRRPGAVHDLVLAGRHAGARLPAASYDARTKTAELTVEQVLPPTPGEPKKKPLHIPVRLGLLGGNGQDLRPDAGVRRSARRTALHRAQEAQRDLPLPRRALARRCPRCCAASPRPSTSRSSCTDADAASS